MVQIDVYLSEHFRLSEFLGSDTADKLGIKSQYCPDFYIVKNLSCLVAEILQPLRDALGLAININSGYRCEVLNKAVNGSKTSQHLIGCACDFTCMFNYDAYEYIKDHLPFDQMIVYGDIDKPRFIHVSWCPNPRKQILRKP